MDANNIGFRIIKRFVPASAGRPEYNEYKIYTNDGWVRPADQYHWKMWQTIENIRDEEVK